jgi:hypothetical protein
MSKGFLHPIEAVIFCYGAYSHTSFSLIARGCTSCMAKEAVSVLSTEECRCVGSIWIVPYPIITDFSPPLNDLNGMATRMIITYQQ